MRSIPRSTIVGVGAVYLLACRIMLAPICNFSALDTASYAGDARLLIWTLAWVNHAVLDGVPALFDANIFHPAANALAYSEHLAGISIFTLPVYAATRNPVLAYNLAWILCYFLTAVTAHLLAWRYTRDHLAATVAGLAAAFCFYRMFQGHGHLHIVWAFWIPLSLLAMERWTLTAHWRWLAALTAIIVLQSLASWYQAVIIVVADSLFFAWLFATEPRARRHTARLLVQGLAGAAVTLGAIWPFARHYGVLTSGGMAEAAAGSADLASLLIPPENTFAGQWLIARGSSAPRWIWGEQTVYLGSITLLMALAGTAIAIAGRDDDRRRARFFILLTLAAMVLALGPSAAERESGQWGWTPLGLLMQVPWIALFRVPARFIELATLAMAVLAALPCARLHARFGSRGRAITICLIPLLLLEFYVVKFPGGAPAPFAVPAAYRFLATEPPGAVVSLPDYADTELWFQEPDYQYFSTSHWRPIANGYSRAAPPEFRPLMDRLITFPLPGAADAMRETGIKYVVVHAGAYGDEGPARIEAARQSDRFQMRLSADGVYVFEVIR